MISNIIMVNLTITVRLIRSFEYANVKPVVLHDINEDTTAVDFLALVKLKILDIPGIPPPFRKFSYDTFKISHKAHGTKSGNLIINIEDDNKLVLGNNKTLKESGVENETELSLFNINDYLKYKEKSQNTLQLT